MERGPIAWSRVVPAIALCLAALLVCGALGWWQWERASEQGRTVAPAPITPIAEVMEPGVSPGAAIGRQVTVTGEWAVADAAIVWGREVDGVPAVFLLRPLAVNADQTGTGEPATLAVLVGWRDAGDPTGVDAEASPVTVTGYVRAAEAPNPAAGVPAIQIDGTFQTATMATAELVQVWDTPLYPALVVSYEGSEQWDVLPPREPETTLDFRSVAYAIEWWIFGAFFVFITLRWIRDNGRKNPPAAVQNAAARQESDVHE